MKRPDRIEKAMRDNNITFLSFYNRLQLLSMSIFKYKGLDEVAGYGASQFLEYNLFTYGNAVLIKDEEIGYKVMSVTYDGKLNNYYLPSRVHAYSIDYKKDFYLDECVYVRNNNMSIPTDNFARETAYRLYEVQRTIDVNVKAQKTPVLLTGNDKSILTLKNVYMQYDGNTPVIYANKQAGLEGSIDCLSTNAPYVADKLENLKQRILNEYLTLIGIKNSNTDKKERVIVSEVESNDEAISYYLGCFLDERLSFCRRAKELYGIDIEVEINSDITRLLRSDIQGEIADNLEPAQDTTSKEPINQADNG